MILISYKAIGRWIDMEWICNFCEHEHSQLIHDRTKYIYCLKCKKLHTIGK